MPVHGQEKPKELSLKQEEYFICTILYRNMNG